MGEMTAAAPGAERDSVREPPAPLEREAGTAPAVVESSGDPAERVLVAARACQASLIAIGRRGANPRGALGSVSERVVRRSPASVLVVP
ncbi:MAG TPA: universal stress protein [Solirubrobacterales bacterium]|nr:universal stress protein [Solirubrobacterales bacterium]